MVIETDEKFNTTITCEKAKFNIAGKSGEDFSYLPYIEKNEPVVLSQFTLKDLIRQTIFSIADNDNNKLMTGELFEINENELKVVSLDGHRIYNYNNLTFFLGRAGDTLDFVVLRDGEKVRLDGVEMPLQARTDEEGKTTYLRGISVGREIIPATLEEDGRVTPAEPKSK